jgi:hypothetical protein
MDRAVANGIVLESPHCLDLSQSRTAIVRLDIIDEGSHVFLRDKSAVEGRDSKLGRGGGGETPKLEETRNRKAARKFLRRAPLQEMKQQKICWTFNALYR